MANLVVTGATDGSDVNIQRQLTVDDNTDVASGDRDGDARANHQDVVAVDLVQQPTRAEPQQLRLRVQPKSARTRRSYFGPVRGTTSRCWVAAACPCLNKHVSSICAACFFRLRQLCRVRMSLDNESVKILVHAFVTARVDYWNMILADGAPRSDRQTATCVERCSTSCQRHAQV